MSETQTQPGLDRPLRAHVVTLRKDIHEKLIKDVEAFNRSTGLTLSKRQYLEGIILGGIDPLDPEKT